MGAAIEGQLLRWHIARLYDREAVERDESDGGGRPVDVAVRPSREDLFRVVERRGFARLVQEHHEERDWWAVEDELELEGWVPESVLLEQFRARHAVEGFDGPPGLERELVEDMVLVQYLPDRAAFDSMRESAFASEDFPDLSDLLRADGSTWIDVTRLARRASGMLYKRVLGLLDEEGGSDNKGDDGRPLRAL